MADLSPTDSFVALEMNKIHSLVMLVNTAMSNMNSLVYGSGLLTPEIQSDGLALLAGETPWRWARNWYGPEAPSSWIKELAMRKMAIVKWMDRVERGSLLSGPLNLAQLFQPSVFLNALRQQTARVSRKPIDSLKLTAAWDSSLLSRAAIKVDIEGMLLQGCLFEGGALSALRPESSLFMGMPNVTLAYISQVFLAPAFFLSPFPRPVPPLPPSSCHPNLTPLRTNRSLMEPKRFLCRSISQHLERSSLQRSRYRRCFLVCLSSQFVPIYAHLAREFCLLFISLYLAQIGPVSWGCRVMDPVWCGATADRHEVNHNRCGSNISSICDQYMYIVLNEPTGEINQNKKEWWWWGGDPERLFAME